MTTHPFETSLQELETIVARMESGQIGLEESLELYRRGAELVRQCQGVLRDVEQQVQVLEGDLLRDFRAEDAA